MANRPRRPDSGGLIDRRALLKTAGIGLLAGLNSESVNARKASHTSGAGAAPAGRYLIRGAHLVTMKPGTGETAVADLYVRDGVIADIGHGLRVSDAEIIDAPDMIVMPGFVDTHWHLWNTVLRNMQRRGYEYFPVKAAFVEHFTPEHVYHSDRLALAEAISAGITTVNNFAHNIRSPAHADAELRAMQESGIRGRFSYGWRDPTPPSQTTNLADIKRVAQQWFGRRSPFEGRVHLGMALRGVFHTDEDVARREFRFAQDHDLPIVLHTGVTKRLSQSVEKLCAAGYIQPSTILVHWIGQQQADVNAAVKSGASVSLSPTSDLRTPGDSSLHDALFLFRDRGRNVCLSIDSVMLANASMFQQMAVAWYAGVPWFDTPSEHRTALDFKEVLEMATINGARALGLEAAIGSLKIGKRADIIMVRMNALSMTPIADVFAALGRAGTVADVDTVMVDGRILKRGGKLVGLDVAAIIANANATLNDLRGTVGGMWAVPPEGI